MTFFTTGSVLAFVKWRDSGYGKLGWLLVSAICMGLAAGSKYNALIAMLFLNMMVIQSYVGDTKQQISGIRYGFLFLLLAGLVASPWYVKNLLLTGNPTYPLFDSLLTSLGHRSALEAAAEPVVKGNREVSFFVMRKVMYGETFWETFFIPLRMFFQGDDNSYQYFQGVLNPVLIVFSPFILLNKRHRKDKILFASFSIFFILMTYFLTAKQVRYSVPALPFLAILTVMGIKDLSDTSLLRGRCMQHGKGNALSVTPRRAAGVTLRALLLSGVTISLLANCQYLHNRLETIEPLPYILNQETREDFLRRHLPYYEAVTYINAHLPEDAVIFTMFLGRRGYYMERAYRNEPSFGYDMIDRLVANSASEERLKEFIQSTGITHILMRTDFVDNYLRDYFPREEKNRFVDLARKLWKMEYNHNLYAVWCIQG